MTIIIKIKHAAELKVQINFVEVSPVLAKIQAESLKADIKSIGGAEDACYMTAEIDEFISCAWYRSIEQVTPSESVCFCISHEFFDALPVHQFRRDGIDIKRNDLTTTEIPDTQSQNESSTLILPPNVKRTSPEPKSATNSQQNVNNNKWREVLVDINEDKSGLRLVLAPNETPAQQMLFPLFDETDLLDKTAIEISPASLFNVQALSARLGQQGGSALIIDYGHMGEKEDTVRAFKNHKLVDFLEEPGECDVTADVNFNQLKVVAESMGLITTDVINQKDFLKNMGIDTR